MPIKNPTSMQQKLIFWAALFLLVAVSVVSLASTNRLIALSERAEQSQIVMRELNRFFSDIQDVETGTRGYVITGDPRYLEPYHAGKADMAKAIAQLRALARGHGGLEARIDGLEQVARRRIAYSDQVVRARASERRPAVVLPGIAEGKAAMDRVRREVAVLAAAEQEAYARRKRAVERQAAITNVALALGVAVSLLALAWLFAIRNREVARRRKAEEELRTLNADLEERVEERTEELARSRELLTAVIENMPDTVFLKDIRDHFRYVLINGAGERLLGRGREELLGHLDHELFPREQAQLCHEEDEQVASTGEYRLVNERTVAVGDQTKIIESRKVSIADPDGSQRYLLGIVRDITEQKSIENQLRQVQRMDAVGRLTGGIAHDFNNILAIILGNLDLLREQLAEGSEAAEMTDEALSAATHGAELVRRLLAFARKQHLEPTRLDLNERLPSITTLLRRTLGENVQLQVRPAPNLWPALVDPTQVDDALVNLAINARDAMPNGGSVVIETDNVTLDEDYAVHHVEVAPGEYVMLAVSDTGTGMPPEVIARAFEPFYTTKAEGRGTGLGLSQVYGWVKQSGGHIKIYSEVGHGTTVKLYLPRATSDDQTVDEGAAGAADAGRGDEIILVVEDNLNVRNTVLRQLRDLGYTTIEAEDGPSALAIVESGQPFDLLLTDVVMPGGMTGYDLAEEVAKRRPDAKVLFTSGYTELASSNGNGNGHSGRGGPLLSKPYRKQDLGRALRAILDS